MKQKLLASLLAGTAMMICMPSASYAEDPDSGAETVFHLKVVHTDGSEVCVPFAERPALTCSGTTLVLVSSTMELEYPEGTLDHFTISTETSQGGDAPMITDDMKATATISGEKIIFSGGVPGALLTVAGIDGTTMATATLDAGGNASISVPLRKGGIYVINSGKTTFKIIKK